MDQLHWIKEYLRVMFAYGFVMYLWPMVVFENHLRGRSRTYRFAFCVTVPIMLVSTVVLMLGLVHLLHPIVTAVLFFGTFLYQLYRNHGPSAEWFRDTRKAITGTMGRKQFWSLYFSSLPRQIRKKLGEWWESTRGRRLEYFLLLVLLAYGTLYFSWGAFDEHSFGFGDQYVHLQWIYGLAEGKSFYDGVYPEAMHSMIYIVCTAFGIRLYSGVLFFAGVHIHVFLISVYLFLKEVFHWRYSPLFALALFLTLDQLCMNTIYGMSRLSWTLPLEYALNTMFLMALFLMRFLKEVLRGKHVRANWLKPREWVALFRDENLFLFMMSLAVSIAVHFYVTIIAFFFCLTVVLVFITQLFRRGSFLPLVLSALLVLLMAATPMLAAFALGYPPQGSLGWALNVMNGTDEEIESANRVFPTPELPEQEPAENILETIAQKANVVKIYATFYWGILHKDAYNELYPGIRAYLIEAATGLTLLVSLPLHFILRIADRHRLRRYGKQWLVAEKAGTALLRRTRCDAFDGYLIVALLSVILMIMYAANSFGLPSLIAGARLCSAEQMLLVTLYVVPVDWIFSLLSRGVSKPVLQAASCALCVGIYVFCQAAGIFHSYLYYELTRYDAAVEMTDWIIDNYPKQMFTIVSTTDEYYQMVENGFHEELLEFVQRITYSDYTIPTPYVFLYIEKRPIHYAQNHFAKGPSWLAWEEYPKIYKDAPASQCPYVRGGEISKEAAGKALYFGRKLSDSAASLDGRIILESKAYQWYEKFSKLYPNEGRVIYEDDDFLCYAFVQNKDCLYQLALITLEEDLASEPEFLETILAEDLS